MTDNLNLSLWVARRAEQGTLQSHGEYVVKEIAELEAKLANAAEAMADAETFIKTRADYWDELCNDGERAPYTVARNKLRAAIAELKESK